MSFKGAWQLILTELEFFLKPEEDIQLPHYTGHISRGILLSLIKSSNPSSSQELHEANVLKPYSVTPIFFKSKKKTDAGYLMDSSLPCTFKIRFLKGKYVRELMKNFERRSSFMLKDKTLRLEVLKVNSSEYEDLKTSAPAEKIHFEFITPTRLSALGRSREYLFPEPKKIFGGLLKIWNDFSGFPIPSSDFEDYMNWLGRESWVTRYYLRTELRYTKKGKIVGFIGNATFAFGESEKWRRLSASLARLSEFSNIGKGRTSGFGVVKTRLFQSSDRS